MIRYFFMALLFIVPLGFAAFSYADVQTKDKSMKVEQRMSYLKLYIGVRYFAGVEPAPFDFTISIDDRVIADNELFPKGDILDETRHGPDSIMVELRPGTYLLKASTKRGDAAFEKKFTIEPDMNHAFAQLNYNYIPLGANQAGYTPPFDFVIQRGDFGWR